MHRGTLNLFVGLTESRTDFIAQNRGRHFSILGDEKKYLKRQSRVNGKCKMLQKIIFNDNIPQLR